MATPSAMSLSRFAKLASLAQDGREDALPEDRLVGGLNREAHGERESAESVPVQLDELVEVP